MKNRLLNFLRELWIGRLLNLIYVTVTMVAVVVFLMSEARELSEDSENKTRSQITHSIPPTSHIQILNTETGTNYKKHTTLSPEESMKWLEEKGFFVEKKVENGYNIICRCRTDCVKLDITNVTLKIETDSTDFIVFTDSENELRVSLP